MNFLDMFQSKKKEDAKKADLLNKVTDKNVHDKKNEYQKNILKIQHESNKLHDEITKAQKSSKRIRRLLSITEATLLATRRIEYGKH